jgi:superfamily II DNA or RNA helicase
LETAKSVKRARDMDHIDPCQLVIANAHKFGTTSNIDIASLPNDFDTIIVDEAHHYPAETWKRIVDKFPESRRIFFTATPYKRDGSLIVNENSQCYNVSRERAVNEGIIRNCAFFEVGNIEDNVNDSYMVNDIVLTEY